MTSSILVGQRIAHSASSKIYVPAEESPHEASIMQWPVSLEAYEDKEYLALVQQTIADIANAISQFEPVLMMADASFHSTAKEMLSNRVELWDIPTEDLWARDSGPLIGFNEHDRRVVSHIQFNGWGGRQAHKNDAQIAARIAKRLGFELVSSGLVGEAGGVEHDGHGLLVAHESSWVNDNRNPGMDRDEIEKRLLAAYGAQKMIWSKGVLGQDITDYHIDSLVRFVGPNKALINLPDEPDMDDPFHMAALDTLNALQGAGVDVKIIPEPYDRRVDDEDFVASYANYYVCNGAVIAAQFGDKETDKIASDALSSAFPDREIVMLNVDVLGENGGGIHCATQQIPSL